MKVKKLFITFHILLFALLQGCASSNVSRNAASVGDSAYQGVDSSLRNVGNDNLVNNFQNSSQVTKGILIGGATGAIAGGLISGVGVLPGAAGGAFVGGGLGLYIEQNTTLVDKIKNRGAQVVVLGDQVMIVLFSNQLFYCNTPNLRPTAYSTLDMVAQLIRGYTTMSVQVAGYTDDIGSEQISCQLSQKQAESVVRYLGRRGTNTRLIYAVGFGDANMVQAHDTSSWSSGQNSRIEITLEKLPV